MTAVGVLGTGIVGKTFAARLAGLGVDVLVGARSADSAASPRSPTRVRTGSFADAAAHADLLVNATNGINSLAVLESIGAESLAGKTVIDLSNELVPVEGGYPAPRPRPSTRSDVACRRRSRRLHGQEPQHDELHRHGRPVDRARRPRRLPQR